MSITITEDVDSREIEFREGKKTGLRRFYAQESTLISIVPNDALVAVQAQQAVTLFSQFPNEPTLLATSWGIRPVPDDPGSLIVEWRHENITIPEFGELQPNEVGYVEISGHIRRELQEQYRVYKTPGSAEQVFGGQDLQVWPQGTIGSHMGDDIGGVPNDYSGNPLTVQRLIQTFEIGVVITGMPPMGNYATFAGRRNANSFLGAPPGTVIFAGAQPQRIAVNKFRVNFLFEYNEFFHMEQVPALDSDLNPILTTWPLGGQRKVAAGVAWRQKAPLFATFPFIPLGIA